jgi:hypothetical protein
MFTALICLRDLTTNFASRVDGGLFDTSEWTLFKGEDNLEGDSLCSSSLCCIEFICDEVGPTPRLIYRATNY